MSSNTSQGLSDRGSALAAGSDTSQVFAIVRDLWHPKDNPTGFVSLGIAENDTMHEMLANYMEKNFKVPHNYLTYLDGGAGSRRLTAAIARFLDKHLKPVNPITKDQIVVTNGTSSSIESVSYNLANPGDGFLLGRPYYRAFLPDMETRTNAHVVTVSFGDIDPFSIEAVSCYEDALLKSQSKGTPIKGLVLCHPHNPLGRCYPKETIIALMKFCEKYQIHLISDEIYALSLWENKEDTSSSIAPTPFISTLSIDSTNILSPHLHHVIWGMSKDFGANGLRIGCTISQSNPSLITALASLSLYTYPSNIADYITSIILEDDTFTDAYIAENQRLLSERFSLAARYLTSHNIPYAKGANAAFFIYADLGSAWRKRWPGWRAAEGEELTKVLMGKLLDKKVFIVDGDAMGAEKEGWFRIVFSQQEETLREGLRRVVEAIEDGEGEGEGGKEDGEGVEVVSRPKRGDGQEDPVGGLAA